MSSPKSSTLIKLNVGGKKFQTSLSTLSKYPESFLYRLVINFFEEKIPTTVDEKGFIFIDRNPKTFAILLEYLRTNEIYLNGLDENQVKAEFDFFGYQFPLHYSFQNLPKELQEGYQHHDLLFQEWFSKIQPIILEESVKKLKGGSNELCISTTEVKTQVRNPDVRHLGGQTHLTKVKTQISKTQISYSCSIGTRKIPIQRESYSLEMTFLKESLGPTLKNLYGWDYYILYRQSREHPYPLKITLFLKEKHQIVSFESSSNLLTYNNFK